MMVRPILVVAGALVRGDGRWLMQCRPEGKHHAGLWEFPGGKVEPDEMPMDSLVRELSEELGIHCHVTRCQPCAFAEEAGGSRAHGLVILLYTIVSWDGDPRPLEGGTIGWFTPAEVLALEKPPLDIQLAERLFANIAI